MSERFAWIYDPVAGVKRWCADMWSRRHILALQQAIAAIVVPTASTTNPQMDGAAAPGVSTDYARADHIHPSDTSKVDSAKFAVITGVCSASSGNSAVTAYPTGFSNSNCVILSLMVSYNAMWRYVGDGVLTQSGRLYALMESTGVSVYNSSSYGYGQDWKVVLMRTDI